MTASRDNSQSTGDGPVSAHPPCTLAHACPWCGQQHDVNLPRSPGEHDEAAYICPITSKLELFHPGHEPPFPPPRHGEPVQGCVIADPSFQRPTPGRSR